MLAILLTGLSTGLIYAIFAVGFTLVFGTLRAVNLTHAGVFVMCAIIGVFLAQVVPSPLGTAFAIVGAGIIGGALLSVSTEFLVLRPIRRFPFKPHELESATMVGTIGLLWIYQVVALVMTGGEPIRYPFGSFDVGTTVILGTPITNQSLVAGSIAIMAMIGLQLLVTRTRIGKATRGVANNPELARFLGINVNRIYIVVLALAGALAGLGGVLIGLSFNQVSASMGDDFLLKGIVIIVIGGMGNVRGTVIAALALGVIEAFTVQYAGSAWRDVITFGILLAVLAWRPSGFEVKERLAT